MPRRAIVLFLPPVVAASVDEIRRRWDPVMADRIGAHITLIHDVVDQDRSAALVTEAAGLTAPFTVHLTTADRWGPSAYGIYLHVEDPTGGIAALHGRLAELEQPAWARAPFRPHVTLVHGRTVDAVTAEAAWVALDGFSARSTVEVAAIDVVELVEPRWHSVDRVALD